MYPPSDGMVNPLLLQLRLDLRLPAELVRFRGRSTVQKTVFDVPDTPAAVVELGSIIMY